MTTKALELRNVSTFRGYIKEERREIDITTVVKYFKGI